MKSFEQLAKSAYEAYGETLRIVKDEAGYAMVLMRWSAESGWRPA